MRPYTAQMARRRLAPSLTLLFGALGAGIALGGCGGGGSVGSAIDPVAQAAEVSELAPGFKASFQERTTVPGSGVFSASGSEDFERNGQRAVFTAHLHAKGKSVTTTAHYAGGAIYLQIPGTQSSSITHGRKWVEYNLADIEAALGVSPSSIPGAGSAGDPTKELSYLRAAGGTVTRIGSQLVQGIPATHYRATIDWSRYPDRVPPAERAAARSTVSVLESVSGSSSQSVDVWIDAEHRVRREDLSSEECLPGSASKAQTHMTMEFFDFGPQAIPKLRSSREVADVTAYLAKQLKHTKLGCQ
jgi:hypothetical protein